MRPLRALLAGLRLLLAALALAGWVGPAAAMSQAMAAAPAMHAASHDHDAAQDGGSHGGKRSGHDATACCAAACGPVVAPQPGCAGAVEIPAAARLRPAPDAFPPGVTPATLKPPPRTPSS